MRLEDVRSHYRRSLPLAAERKPVAEPPRASLFDALLDGRLQTINGRSSFYVETSHDVGQVHGRHTFGEVIQVPGEALAVICRDPHLASLDLSQAVFLDTETTGLGGGVGTYAFMVGAGYVDDGAFRVRRYFLDSPGDEAAFLDHLGTFLNRFTALVTFNGRAFDWPILENRYILHRRPVPLECPLHVDLLHAARRLWKRRLSSCALASLEAHVLGIPARIGDVPGEEIPSLYFQYQRTGSARLLEPVFRHNLLDVLALAVLLVQVCRVVEDPTGDDCGHPVDILCVGRAHERSGAVDLAVEYYEEASRRELPSDDRTECLIRLATIHRRTGDWARAAEIWDRMLDEGGPGALFGLVERAKYLEHVEHDYMRALEAAQRALQLADLSNAHATHPQTQMQQLERRLARLLERTIRSRVWTTAGG